MRRRRFLAVGAVAVTAVAAGCTSGPGGPDDATPTGRGSGDGRTPSPGDGTTRPTEPGDGTPSQESPFTGRGAAVVRFFGSRLDARRAGSFGLSRAELRSGTGPERRLGPVLRVRYPARSASPTVARTYDRPEGGTQLYLPLATGPVDRLHLRYYVRFPEGFDFVKGGKLPGLYGGTNTSGGHVPDGSNGLSTRYMWRSGGRGEVYAYLPASVVHGTSLGRGSWSWPVGRWACVEQGVRLNRPGRADGSVTVYLDGRQVLRRDRLTFRTTRELRIEGVFFSTFFGGGDPSWATPRAQYADFAAFAVSDHAIGPLPGDAVPEG
ncbi:polysaccharide lyase [Streptomyces sp. NPDC059785]|uniref:polysaccharide lyase n=1 Tax=unclassified Streptomyces TaxID=2593676 RepID=UPI0036694C4D